MCVWIGFAPVAPDDAADDVTATSARAPVGGVDCDVSAGLSVDDVALASKSICSRSSSESSSSSSSLSRVIDDVSGLNGSLGLARDVSAPAVVVVVVVAGALLSWRASDAMAATSRFVSRRSLLS